ncbi:MAG: acyl-CoA thioesterase [Kiritimatiellae bacterium]|nr:acyl-CoA thioesterase [Kiritimatiellia bacterium]
MDKQGCYRHLIRVPYAHVDQMKFVYYANYLVYFEMARTGMLRDSGTPYSVLEERGVLLPVMAAHCEYRQPAHYEDLLAVDVDFPPFKGVRFRLNYKVWRVESGTDPQPADEDLLVEGYTEHVCMSPGGKVLRPDPAFVQLVRH